MEGEETYSFITWRDSQFFSRFNRGLRGRGGTVRGRNLPHVASSVAFFYIELKAEAYRYSVTYACSEYDGVLNLKCLFFRVFFTERWLPQSR